MATVAGLFEHTEDVNKLLAGLKEMGFDHGDISIASPATINPDELEMTPSTAPAAGGTSGKQGMLVTVVAEGDMVERVKRLLETNGAAQIDIRHNVWERGTVEDYEETTAEQRNKRSSLGNRQ